MPPGPYFIISVLPLLLMQAIALAQSKAGSDSVQYFCTESASVIHDAKSIARRSHLGYRVAVLKQGIHQHLLVSDPLASLNESSATSGVVYRLLLSSALFNATHDMRNNSVAIPFEFNNSSDLHANRSLAQFGASIATLSSGEFAICAPGYNFANVYNQTVTPGVCAYWDSIDSNPRWLQKLFNYVPHISSADERMFGNCLGGFDVELFDVAAPKLAVSGPFCMHHDVVVVSLANDTKDILKSHNIYGYTGFSLASEREKSKPDLFVTIPCSFTTRSFTVLRRITNTSTIQDIVMHVQNPDFNQLKKAFNYMGYSSATIKTVRSNQNHTALVLGAPFESNASIFDFGCVYIVPISDKHSRYMSSELVLEQSLVRYCGRDQGGRLGTSVISIGDINDDGSDDFAVGCPGCGANGTGAVYLFLGPTNYQAAQGGLKLEPFEVFEAASEFPGIVGLGWSLALAGDLDGNGASELVVSAIGSNHVILLPARKLLQLSVEVSYKKGDITISELAGKDSIEADMTLSFSSSKDFNASIYLFDFEVKLDEFVKIDSFRRFNVEVVGRSALSGDVWHRPTRINGEINKLKFSIKFRIKFTLNTTRHLPARVLLGDLMLLVQWRMQNRRVADQPMHPFPIVFQNGKLSSNYENKLTVKFFGFKEGVCEGFLFHVTGNLRLELLNSTSFNLSSYQPITIALLVKKASEEPFYGGAAIQFNFSNGILVLGNAEIQERGVSRQVAYWNEHKEVLVAEPFSMQKDILTKTESGSLLVYVRLRFDGKHSSYRARFHLINVIASEGYQGYVTSETNETDNYQAVEIKFNTSLTLNLLPKKANSTVVDSRKSTDEAYLKSLEQRVSGEEIGPSLQHTYELFAASKPMLPVYNVSLTVRVPFVTLENKLLLFFPRNSIRSSVRATGSRLQPGLPFISSDPEGFVDNKDFECRPVEADLVKLLFRPDLILLEMKHHNNASDLIRLRREVPSLPNAPRLLPDQNVSFISFAKTNSKALPDGKSNKIVPIFDCDRPELAPAKLPFKCITFNCPVRTLIEHTNATRFTADRVYLHVHARIWSPTFFDKAIAAFSIKSHVTLDWKPSTAFLYVDKTDNASVLETFHFVNAEFPIEKEIPWGYVIMAIFLGIWLLLLCILLLWYCNFFKREKFDYSSTVLLPMTEVDDVNDDFYK